MSDPKDWELHIRNGEIDAELAKLYCRTPFPGNHRIVTIDDLDTPELWSPKGKLVDKGEEDIKEYLLLAQEFESC